ncbi:PfkB family carbohydrate kinase [Amycolatopsis magusensis]|uniref:PfkB family carbohydrate kinase n=1 Tax=Amycolatopsis magusensis TaxID=882444 RepID=UPI0024A8101A|nr:PfkB family carbohydrate kinase [Amycolatopsis magusensis]MDI5977115.1 PfkB family carbohydrate kinase [Amycolatopsis magusensis]
MRVVLAGLSTVDLVQRVAELPSPGEKVQSLAVEVAAGGPAANAAVTVAALGGEAILLTVLGAHPLASLARADLEAYGVRVVDALPSRVSPPPVSAVSVRDSDGERTVVSHNAADVPDFPVSSLVDEVSGDCVLLDGHHPALALAVARRARELGVPVVLDAGSWKPVLTELLPLVDIAACSAHFRAPDGVLEVPVVITTAGAEPVRYSTVDESGTVPVPEVEAADTLGAGDVWHGAFAYGARLPLVERIRFANEVAAERVWHAGPRAWVPAVREMRK